MSDAKKSGDARDAESAPEDARRVVLAEGAETEELSELIGREVVLDTRAEIVYLGTLKKIGRHFYQLESADVHEMVAGRTSKEIYILESFKHGLKRNRALVYVRKADVLSLSALDDIVEY